MVFQPLSTTMVEKINVSTSSMFATSHETHLYGGPSVPPGYQLLFGTLSGEKYSPFTYPVSSTSRIKSVTYLMNTI